MVWTSELSSLGEFAGSDEGSNTDVSQLAIRSNALATGINERKSNPALLVMVSCVVMSENEKERRSCLSPNDA